MANEADKTKLLIVDVSPSMAQVLKTFAELRDYDCDVFSDTALACEALSARFVNITDSYDCILLGWPEGKIGIISDLLGRLATPDCADLPMIVLSQNLNNDVHTLCRRRSNTQSLLWKDYEQAEDIIEGLVFHDEPVNQDEPAKVFAAATRPTPAQIQSPIVKSTAGTPVVKTPVVSMPKHVLLVDYGSPVCFALRDLFKSGGYHVTVVRSASEARAAVDMVSYDLVVTEFYLRAESGEDLCRYLKEKPASMRPVYAVMTSKNLDVVVQKSLAAGAITCLDKTQSAESLFTRLNTIADGIGRTASVEAENIAMAAPVPIAPKAPVPVIATAPAAPAVSAAPVVKKVAKPIVKPIVKPRATFIDTPAIERAIGSAIASASDYKVCYCVLMLDIKLVASATGDRLSLGASDPMLEMVKEKIAQLYTRKNSLAYLGNGKFALLLATGQAKQALLLARKLVEVIPTAIKYLSDVELVTHGSFIQLSATTKLTPQLVLTHCAAACARTELDKADNRIYVINKDQYVPALSCEPAESARPVEQVPTERKTAPV